ncbi:MAG: hypothetical protein DCC75_00050 [Proteobacteria bacterium]|nr:MAG: hypothetical protein DCC75_00050 [Pseudomonadota bacterium]
MVVYGVATLLLLTFAYLKVREGRSAHDVLEDLSEESLTQSLEQGSERDRLILKDELSQLGLYEKEERRSILRLNKCLPLLFAAVFAGSKAVLFSTALMGLAASALAGFAFGYLFSRSRIRRMQAEFIRQVEFYLPIIMERLVMAVQAGLDIMPAIKTLLDLEERSAKLERRKLDPVSRLLAIVYRLTNAGLTFEQALKDVSAGINCPSFKHAFIHLGLAQREGGELVMPLRELSDATQLYYQESIEEEIAKMPVKATGPLLLTFAGLIMFFITSPVIQIMNLMLKSGLK